MHRKPVRFLTDCSRERDFCCEEPGLTVRERVRAIDLFEVHWPSAIQEREAVVSQSLFEAVMHLALLVSLSPIPLSACICVYLWLRFH
jgi:hypothetical protein